MRRPRTFPKSVGASVDWKTLIDKGMQGSPGFGGSLDPTLHETTAFGPNPGALKMFMHVPAGLPHGAPLVIVLHGCSQNAAGYATAAGWTELADRQGFAVLAPEQVSANNMNCCFGWFQPADTTRGSGEAASIRAMVDRAVQDHHVDPTRIFVTGLSAGGAMAAVMLATYPEVFAGGAIVAGLPYGAAAGIPEALASMRAAPRLSARAWGDRVRAAAPSAGRWPRVSIWHGDADQTVSVGNADALVSQWGDVLGLGAKPSVEDTVDGFPHRVWNDPSGQPVLERYTVTGLGHGTPIRSGSAADECGTARPFVLEAGISSSYRIAQFWGLVADDGSVSRPAGSNAAGDARARMSASVGAPSEAGRQDDDVMSVITGALKKAGLLRHR